MRVAGQRDFCANQSMMSTKYCGTRGDWSWGFMLVNVLNRIADWSESNRVIPGCISNPWIGVVQFDCPLFHCCRISHILYIFAHFSFRIRPLFVQRFKF